MAAGRKAEYVAHEVGVSAHTIYACKLKYGGMDVSEAQEAKRLRDENSRLRKLVVECPAKSVPDEMRQTGMEGAEDGQGKEAHA